MIRHLHLGEITAGWRARVKVAATTRAWNQSDVSFPGTHAIARRASGRRNLWLILFVIVLIAMSAVLIFFRDRIFRHPEQIVLSLQGSTSLGDELMPRLAAAFLRDEMGAEQTGFRIAGRDENGHPFLHVWGKVPGRQDLQVIEIYAAGSSDAFRCLATESGRGACDIGMASRPINDSDRAAYPDLKNLGDRANEHVIALDGIAIVVNPKNPVVRLSIPQLRAIYTGQIKNWRDVGGLDAPIELYGRDRNSGTFEMFTEKVIGKDATAGIGEMAVSASHQIGDSGSIVDSVMRSANAIGYVSSPMIRGAKAVPISDGSGPAFPPTQLAIVTEDYPICRRLLLYDWDAPGSLMNAFVRYVVYKPGQTLVTQTPFVELTPKVFAVIPPQDAPRAYKELASSYSRIGLSFHFSSDQADAATDTNQLDNLARVNVLRLRTFLAQHGGTGDDIFLIGFADQYEERIPKQNLARKRAESVATSLRAIGVIVPSENVRDFGASLPVASNDNSEGRRRNRRVEVWVRNKLN